MISYQTTNLGAPAQDGYNTVLNEAKALFEEQHINILGEGYQEILADEALFEDYKSAMLKGVDPDELDELSQLIDNSRLCTLQESISGITPISSLAVPTIRKLWPRMALKNAMPTEVVKLPKFTISYLMPYVIKNGVRHYLPEALQPGGSAEDLVEGQSLYEDWIELADFDPGTGIVDGAIKGFKLLDTLPGAAVASVTVGDSVDPDFYVVGVRIETTQTVGGASVDLVDVENLRIGTGLDGNIYYEVSAYNPNDLSGGVPVAGATPTTDKLFGQLNRIDGTLTLASPLGLVKAVKIKGRLSSEFNLHAESVSFDIKNRDITIGTGTHINAPLPIEFLQDVMAMYNIDGAAKVVDIMTNVLALKLDHEIRDFIVDRWVASPNQYQGAFDLQPYAQFSGTPKQWREMLKDVIDHHATNLKQASNYTGGKFVIVGNELDTNLLPNVTWTFVGNAGERSGVNVDYSLGAISGQMRYEIISSPAMPQGNLYVFFVSAQDEQMTFKYYPYSFNVEKGYSDPQYSYVPAIMLAKRHKLETFQDSIIKISIANNDGDVSFTP